MKQKLIVLAIILLLVLLAIILYLASGNYCTAIEINNTTPVSKIATEYNLEKLLLIEAIFYVRSGFEDVNGFDLAKEVEVKLECKRQVSDTQFYYVVVGDGYKCFIVTAEKDIVQEVLVVRDFASIAQTKEYIEKYGSEISIVDTTAFRFCEIWRDCGYSSVYKNSLFILQDGVMIMQTLGNKENARYIYFTDEEWQQVYEDWGGFLILPIDKQ